MKMKHIPTRRIPARLIFIIVGVISTVWFLIRVIPKPSRAAYPCVRAAAPFMSGFVIYLLGLASSVVAFKRAKSRFMDARYVAAGLFVLAGVVAAFVALSSNSKPVYANTSSLLEANAPIGVPRGINPGRVVWSWEPDATNENCTNEFGDAWDLPQNTDMNVVDAMCSNAINSLVGATNTTEAWDTIFRYFNAAHNKGPIPYTSGEKIFIKMNFVGGHRNRLNENHSRKEHSRYGNSQASPQIGLAVLRQLVNGYGISQEDISIGDPSKNIYKSTWDLWTSEFPDVNYIAELDEMGRTMAVAGENPVLFYSDRGTVLGSSQDYLCSALEESDYLINISALKGHERAGITLNAKNHYGSHMSADASHLHPGLVGHNESSSGYGKYRTQVDLMGHELLGEKTLLFLIDGLWSGPDANLKPVKWQMSPFANDWTSSVFVSQDHVAMEAVCYDFLRNEYTVENSEYPYPQMEGTDDYLLQAADPSYWPAGIIYDPENDGTPIKSMGVFEQWNNVDEKKYSRNLGTGEGIELMKLFYTDVPNSPKNLQYELKSETSATLTWEQNTAKTSHYIIEQSIGNDQNFEQIAMVDSTFSSYELSVALNTDLFFYRIKALNGASFSGYSSTIELTTAIPLAPSELTGVAVNGSQVLLTWEANSSIEEYYMIEKSYRTSTNFSSVDTISADSTTYLVSDLPASSYYFFRVKALNLSFASAYSNKVYVLTGPSALNPDLAEGNDDLEVYPNPVMEICTVRLKNKYNGPVQVDILKLNGSKVMGIRLNKDQEELYGLMDLSQLPVGAYLIDMKYGEHRLVKKVFKSK